MVAVAFAAEDRCHICTQQSLGGPHPNCVNPPGPRTRNDARALSDDALRAMFGRPQPSAERPPARCLTCQGKGWRLATGETCHRCHGTGIVTYPTEQP